MAHRFRQQSALLEPLTGSAVEGLNLIWVVLLQATVQQIAEQMVIAIPTPLIIERDQK